MKKYLFTALAVLVLAHGPAYAQDGAGPAKNNPPPRVYGGRPRGVFAFQGKECPPGSRLYTGPELGEIEKTGAVYCLFERRYAWFRKLPGMTKCPGGGNPVPASSKNPSDIMWCDMPRSVFAPSGLFVTIDPATAPPPRPAAAPVPPPSAPALMPVTTTAPRATPVTASTSGPSPLPISTSASQPPVATPAPAPESKSPFEGILNWLKQL
jgi:hypothetical protein